LLINTIAGCNHPACHRLFGSFPRWSTKE
jgi:hypothetical protein